MKLNRGTVAALAAVGALALAVPAIAQDDGEAPGTEQEARDEAREDRVAAKQDRLAEALAEELGLPTEDVAAALEAVRDRFHAEREAERLERLEERLTDAVAEGDLTEAQADAILEAARNGVFPGGMKGKRGHHLGPGPHGPRGFDRPGPGPSTGDAPSDDSAAA